MSKNIRTYLWILMIPLLIIIAFGITASFAAAEESSLKNPNADTLYVHFENEGYEDTTVEEMLKALDDGKNLTGISGKKKDKHPGIYCRERYWALYIYGLYERAGDAITLPGTAEDGYAQAYVLAAPGYVKSDSNTSTISGADERQWAWYFILGQNRGSANDLYHIAMDYQEYKDETESDVVVTTSKADTKISGSNAIYGPITVQYSYAKSTSGDKSDEWGGFYYSFFDETGASINDDVKLCTLSGTTYTAITSTKVTTDGETKGYYQVKETTYNNANLYIVTSSTTIRKVTLKIKENRVDYSAKIHPLKGEYYRKNGYTILCQDHQYYEDNAYTKLEDALAAIDGGKTNVYYMTSNGKIYEYNQAESTIGEDVYFSSTQPTISDIYYLGSEEKTIERVKTAQEVKTDGWCYICQKYHSGVWHYSGGHNCKYHTSLYQCTYCHSKSTICNDNNDHINHYNRKCTFGTEDAAREHVKSKHKTNAYLYKRNTYKFTQVTTPYCDAGKSDKNSGCGTHVGTGWAHSQGLYLVETATATQSNELKLDIDIQFRARVEVSKVWADNSNVDQNRTSSITVKLIKDGVDTGKTLTLKSSNNWTGAFEDLEPTQSDGTEIRYTINEITVNDAYTTTITEKSHNVWVITNTLKTVEEPVQKVWDDDSNRDGKRPSSITVKLLADGEDTGKTLTLNADNNWKSKFTGLAKYKNKKLVTYTAVETEVDGYTVKYEDLAKVYKITNTHVPEKINIPVSKVWDDDNNRDGIRPSSIEVTLYANGTKVTKDGFGNSIQNPVTIEPNNNEWKYTFENVFKYENGQVITYTVKETAIDGYTTTEGNSSNNYTITNKHVPEEIKIPVTKIWNHNGQVEEDKPESITVKLIQDGEDTGKTLTLNESNQWTDIFTDLYKYRDQGTVIKYTIEEITVPKYDTVITGNQTSGYTITNTYYDGYVEITGKVWLDKLDLKSNTRNGTYDSGEEGLGGIKVTLKDVNGEQFDDNSVTTTRDDGTYTIKVNYDNSKNVYKLYDNVEDVKDKLETAYVEFEYNGMKYTTVATATTGENTSKAKENESERTTFDETYTKITSSTDPSIWETEKIKASTQNVISFEEYNDKTNGTSTEKIRYCIGSGKHQYTNPNGAWNAVKQGTHTCDNCTNPLTTYDVEIEIIKNVNLGLFEREQPRVGLKADLTKVYVTMKGQNQGPTEQDQKYTYEYGEKSDETKDVGLKAQFETKYTYEYMRPVNPADISYIQKDGNKDAMNVFVTYEIRFANLSNEVDATLHNITNYFDKRYTLKTEGWIVTEGTDFNTATYNGDLNITMEPNSTAENGIEVTYQISTEAIRDLLNNKATLNHASEVESYSSKYGETTVYAEQQTGGRTGNAYAGYDYESHPGNAGMYINTENGKIDAEKYEKDTDIAPSFVLLMDENEPKTLSGTVYEDTNIKTNGERVGNGKFDSSTEKTVKNVKVELYNLDGTIAKLYQTPGSTEETDAVAYTDEKGEYSLQGVVTGAYFIKFTYGDDTTELTKGATTIDGTTTINGRNYKSTIIAEDSIIKSLMKKEYSNFTEEEKMWPINIQNGYSVAVDNMLDRLDIQDLQNSNFDTPINITAYTKPFKTKVEFDADETGNTDANGDVEGVSNNLANLYFGIIERPREDLFVEKTITNIKLELANGQTLINGDPRSQTLNYAKTMGFQDEITNGLEARTALPRRLLVEMDVELIQGAELSLDYLVKVTNNNEIDYNYGDKATYENEIKSVITEGECDKYITTNELADYYYYGTNGQTQLSSTIEMVDYLYGEMIYESNEWVVNNAEELRSQGLICTKTYNEVKDNKYKIYKNGESATITLGKGDSWTQTMSVSKSLSNNNDNVYENSLEIIRIDSKTARTIQESSAGKQVPKSYTPGNYIPSEHKEQDSDIVEVIITPPTGLADYITYLVAGLAGLIVIAVVVIFIKKKALIK